MEENAIPFIRPGVLHYIGSFFRLDEDLLLSNPDLFYLDPKRVERGAEAFCQSVAYDPRKKEHSGWEILYSALGIPVSKLQHNPKETARNFVLRIWGLVMKAQEIPMSLHVEKVNGVKQWMYHINPLVRSDVQVAMQQAKYRIANSPLWSKKTKVAECKKTTKIILDDDDMFFLQVEIGKYIRLALNNKERVLFLAAHMKAGQHALTFLQRRGAKKKELVTTDLIDDGKGYHKSDATLHKAQVLLISADYVPLRVKPEKYDKIILWNLPSILSSLHAENPLPNFIEMSKKEKRKYPPHFYKDLWKAADLFHFFRDIIQDTNEVFVTGIKSKTSKEVQFLERMRGPVSWIGE